MRRRLRVLRRDLARDRKTASDRAAVLAPLHLWPSRLIVAGYLAMETEFDPAPLLRRFALAGARVVLPVVVARDAPLVFREAEGAGAFHADAAGIPAPPPTAPTLAPRLWSSPRCSPSTAPAGRLGPGRRLLRPHLARAARARAGYRRVGLAFAGQEVEHVPMASLDERLDAILTETGYIEVPRRKF